MRRQIVILLLVLSLPAFLLLSMPGCSLGPRGTVEEAVQSFERGDSDAANRALEAVVRERGGGSEAYSLVAKRLADRGRPAEAATFLETAVKEKRLKNEPFLWATLADVARKAGDTARAEDAETQAKTSAAAMMRTIGTAPVGDMEAAQRFIQLGFYLYEHAKQMPSALLAWREAYRLAPQDPRVLNTLGYMLADNGTTPAEFDEALTLTRQAVERIRAATAMPAEERQFWEMMILDSYGWALYKTGDLQRARRVIHEAADGLPNQHEIRYHLGVIYAELGLIDEADKEFARVLRIMPDYAAAQKARERLRKTPAAGAVKGAGLR